MQYDVLIHTKYRKKNFQDQFWKFETQIVLEQHDLMSNLSESTISLIKNLKTELNSIYDTKAKMNMLNNRIVLLEDNDFFLPNRQPLYW